MTRMLRERLGPMDTVVSGLGAMVGAGVFAGIAPAAGLAGRWFLPGIVLAAVVAACCCCSTGDQPGVYPGAGAGYRYTREDLGRWPGRMAGGLYLVGRGAAATALADCFGDYLAPTRPLPAAMAVLVLAVLADLLGLRVPRSVVRALTVFVLVVLGLVVLVCFAIAPPPPTGVVPPAGMAGTDDVGGLLPAAGVMFFAFLGFERVTAPGGEQGESAGQARRRLRLVILLLVGVALVTYLVVSVAVLRQLDPFQLAISPTPLRDALDAADGAWLDPVVTVGACVATAMVLLGVLGGARQTAEAMAGRGDLPTGRPLTAARRETTSRRETMSRRESASRRETTLFSGPAVITVLVAIGGAVGLLVASPAAAIGLAATCGLFHYAFTNAAARLLNRQDRSWPARTACFGLGLSVLIGLTMSPVNLVLAGAAMLLGALGGPLVALGRARRRTPR